MLGSPAALGSAGKAELILRARHGCLRSGRGGCICFFFRAFLTTLRPSNTCTFIMHKNAIVV